MSKKSAGSKPVSAPAVGRELPQWFPLPLAVLCFLGIFLTTASTSRPLLLCLIVAAVASCLLRLGTFGPRLTWPVAAIFLWLVMNGASMFYALSGKFAFREFRWLSTGFCVFLLILAWGQKGKEQGRTVGAILTGAIALTGLVSVDMLSTHWLSDTLFNFLGLFGKDYAEIRTLSAEAGVRMVSAIQNPNIFGGMTGIGVLLSLGLANTAEKVWERRFQLVCLFWCALSFLLAFSMGATAVLGLALVVFLFVERRERRGGLLLLMVETFLLALAFAFPIFVTSFQPWSGFQPVPLLCALAGAVLLCALDHFLVRPLSLKLAGRDRVVTLVIAGVLVLGGLFAALSMNITGPATLAAGETLRRSVYPTLGQQTLTVESTGELTVLVESQNREETMMHTSTILYEGPAQGAAFTVPEDSLVVYCNLTAGEAQTVSRVTCSGGGDLKLNYRLLPGFIANRLQGLRANENAIQRTVFFEDGMKLFLESPVVGSGLGSFENALRHIQSFEYDTKYVHNHYIETLLSTGVVGLVLFVGMLVLLFLVLIRDRRREDGSPLGPVLLAALLFMAGHAGVEVVFSSSHYLVCAFGVFGLICLCCSRELPLFPDRSEAQGWCTLGMGVALLVFAVTVGMNLRAQSMVKDLSGMRTFSVLETASSMDLYENADYKLSYVVVSLQLDRESNQDIAKKADIYAQELAKKKSNSIPPYLAQYYFATQRPQLAFERLEQYVAYLPSYSAAWQESFRLLATYYQDTPAFREEAVKLYGQLREWDENNMGSIVLTDANRQFLDGVLAG